MNNCGFKVVKKSTLGFLDLDIVKKAYKEGNIEVDR